jgi:hypothetical protein
LNAGRLRSSVNAGWQRQQQGSQNEGDSCATRKHHWASPLLASGISLNTLFQVFTSSYRSFTLLLRVYHSLQSFDQVKKGKGLMVARVSFDNRSRSLFGAPTSAIPQLKAPVVSIAPARTFILNKSNFAFFCPLCLDTLIATFQTAIKWGTIRAAILYKTRNRS